MLPAFRATAKAGNVVVTALTPDTVTEINIPPLELFVTQKAIMGAVYGFASPRLQIPELLALYRRGEIKLKELITRTLQPGRGQSRLCRSRSRQEPARRDRF